MGDEIIRQEKKNKGIKKESGEAKKKTEGKVETKIIKNKNAFVLSFTLVRFIGLELKRKLFSVTDLGFFMVLSHPLCKYPL